MYPWNDSYWLAFYDCALQIAGFDRCPKLDALAQVITETGWFVPMHGLMIIGTRPVHIHRDANGFLHSEEGPALLYRDGWGLYSWHGRTVESWVIHEPTMERISKEENTEVRRCAIESMGWDRFLAELQAGQLALPKVPDQIADPGNPGQFLALYDVPAKLWGSPVKILLCTNGSTERDGTRRRYGLTVPAHIQDPLEAAAWTAGLTRDQYAGMQRRT